MNMEIRKEDDRNVGVEILRIVAMFMIVILHILSLGLNYNELIPYTQNWYIANFLEAVCFCAVDIYAIISGYVLVCSKNKIMRLIELWMAAFFYSIISVFLDSVIYTHTIEIKEIIKACLTVFSERFWYFTAYFMLFWFIPLFNWIIKKLTFEQLRSLLFKFIIVIGIFSWISEPLGERAFGVMGGYSALWLAVLYFIGGGLRIYGFKIFSIKKKEHSQRYFLGWGILGGIGVFLSKVVLTTLTLYVFKREIFTTLFYSYTSPLVLMQAIFLVCFFVNLKINYKKIWIFSAKMTFGIYLIQLTPLFGKSVWHLFEPYTKANGTIFIAVVFIGAVSIFGICFIIEFLRQKIFQVCKVNQVIERMAKKINRFNLI